MTGPLSAHARYRAGLELVADTDALVDILVFWGMVERRPWRRHYGRFHPDRPEWATIVLDAPGVELVTVALAQPPGGGGAIVAEHCSVSPFHADPSLPRLGESVRAFDVVDVVRYRPGSRCTMRVSAQTDRRFVKVGRAWRELHEIGEVVRAAVDGGRLDVAVAEPLGFEARRMEVHQGVVPGEPIVDRVLGAGGPEWSRRLGGVLGALAMCSAEPAARSGADEQLARTGRALRRAAARVPELEHRLSVVQHRLAVLHDSLVDRPLVPTHGAPHVHQWLADGDRLGLVDFDRFALGEPELDVATYLAELDSETDLHHGIDEHEAAIADGFAEAAWPLDPHRLWLHRVHKRCAKVARTTMALRPDGDRRAERHLRAVERLLDDGD